MGLFVICGCQLETVLVQVFGIHENAEKESSVAHHFIAITGAMAASIGIILIMLGFFQPSSNARKFALAAVALLQYFNIRVQYRYPIFDGEPPESILEMPIPLSLGLMGIALIGALFSKTDGQRRQIIRNRKKAELYAKHATGKVTKAD